MTSLLLSNICHSLAERMSRYGWISTHFLLLFLHSSFKHQVSTVRTSSRIQESLKHVSRKFDRHKEKGIPPEMIMPVQGSKVSYVLAVLYAYQLALIDLSMPRFTKQNKENAPTESTDPKHLMMTFTKRREYCCSFLTWVQSNGWMPCKDYTLAKDNRE